MDVKLKVGVDQQGCDVRPVKVFLMINMSFYDCLILLNQSQKCEINLANIYGSQDYHNWIKSQKNMEQLFSRFYRSDEYERHHFPLSLKITVCKRTIKRQFVITTHVRRLYSSHMCDWWKGGIFFQPV